jgi:hypothetical protein
MGLQGKVNESCRWQCGKTIGVWLVIVRRGSGESLTFWGTQDSLGEGLGVTMEDCGDLGAV